MMQQTTPLPVGVKEIAHRAGVTEITARKWVERHDQESATPFPRSIGPVSGRGTYWWHEVVDWMATTGRLVRVSRLERWNPETLVTEWVTIRYDQVARDWLLHTGDDDTAIHGHAETRPERPWVHQDEDDLVAEIRQHLLDGWTVTEH